jgi:hypothetical protein
MSLPEAKRRIKPPKIININTTHAMVTFEIFKHSKITAAIIKFILRFTEGYKYSVKTFVLPVPILSRPTN